MDIDQLNHRIKKIGEVNREFYRIETENANEISSLYFEIASRWNQIELRGKALDKYFRKIAGEYGQLLDDASRVQRRLNQEQDTLVRELNSCNDDDLEKRREILERILSFRTTCLNLDFRQMIELTRKMELAISRLADLYESLETGTRLSRPRGSERMSDLLHSADH